MEEKQVTIDGETASRARRFSSSPPRTRLRRRAPSRCPKPRWTGS
jgi:hypothetical protein